MSIPAHHRHPRWLIGWLLRLATATALAIDAYVHADLIPRYTLNQGSAAISQGDLFRIEAAVSAFAALALILTARRVIWTLAVLVAASALGGLLVYRYANPGALGPLPDMYEPTWYPEKTLTAIAETVATLTALAGWVITPFAPGGLRARWWGMKRTADARTAATGGPNESARPDQDRETRRPPGATARPAARAPHSGRRQRRHALPAADRQRRPAGPGRETNRYGELAAGPRTCERGLPTQDGPGR